MRPEVLESNFYAWRVTGDEKYQQRALAAAQSMNKFLQVNNAFAGINNVSETNSGFIDDTESFFFAEVMKYLCVLLLSFSSFEDILTLQMYRFLTFDDPEHISVDNCKPLSNLNTHEEA